MNSSYEGILAKLSTKEIYLHVNHLEKGNYQLKIIYNDKVITTAHFEK